ncbi:MAG: peptidoglycan D,D-transpeptidase FtsI family protein, partial [Trebonia sp.]
RRLILRRGDPGRRIGITVLAIAIVLTLFAGRLVQLQGMESAHLKAEAASEQVRNYPLPAVRGDIYGANGQPLAMTLETYTIADDPAMLTDTDKPTVAQELAGPLGLTATRVLSLLRNPSSPEYVKLADKVPATAEGKIEGFNIRGLIISPPTLVRTYPNGPATANVVGLTNTNTKSGVIQGQSGIEADYNSLLTGTAGSEQVMVGADGVPIPLAGSQVTPARDGTSIRLTINPTLQFQAQQACQQEVAKAKAENCSVVIIAPKTGAILAMAQWPTYDQNTFTSIPDHYMFDPGSTAKVITAAAAFEHGGQTPMSSYKIPYAIYRGGQWIHDAEWSPDERYTIAGIIANSSNIGMSQVVAHVPEQMQYDYLRAF